MRYITRVYRQLSKKKANDYNKYELNLKSNLEVDVATLHEDVYNMDKQSKINQLKYSLDEIETRKAKGAAIRAKVI